MKKCYKSFYSHIYERGQQLGSGGNSNVYEAINEKGEVFAIKVFNESRTKNDRYEKELEFQRNAKCNYIVPILDFGRNDNGTLKFYVMPKYKCSLKDLIRSDKFRTQHMIKLYIDVCRALRYAHDKCVIHRDLKPENIFYDENNKRLVLGDFGIAHFEKSSLTKSGDRMANANYKAPEQIEHSGVKVGPYTDIYAAGLILNEIFTKEIPNGTNYKLISDVDPVFARFDGLVTSMIENSTEYREKSFVNVINRIEMYMDEIDKELDNNRYLLDVVGKSSNEAEIIDQACKDLAYATNLLKNRVPVNQVPLNLCRNQSIRYKLSDNFGNDIIICELCNELQQKFRYEGGGVVENYTNQVISHMKDYDSLAGLNKFMSMFATQENRELFNYCRKLFVCIAGYHASEVLNEMNDFVSKTKGGCFTIEDIIEKMANYINLIGIYDDFSFAEKLVLDLDNSMIVKYNSPKPIGVFSLIKNDIERKYYGMTVIQDVGKNCILIFESETLKASVMLKCKKYQEEIELDNPADVRALDMKDLLEKMQSQERYVYIDIYDLSNLYKALFEGSC